MNSIVGPCAAQSRDQMALSAANAIDRGFTRHRGNPDKPRTKPGFSGHGELAMPWVIEVAQMGIDPATEALTGQQADRFVDAVIKNSSQDAIVWIGSRNYNHVIQREIASAVAGEPRAKLLIKNPMFERRGTGRDAWLGAVEHVLDAGVNESQLILCHRGFQVDLPGYEAYRNPPLRDLAMDVKRRTGLPMYDDPSHIAGRTDLVLEELRTSLYYTDEQGTSFDGIMLEVHPDPTQAQTDKDQAVSWDQIERSVPEFAKGGIIYETAEAN